MRSIYNDFVSPEEKGEIGEDIIYRDLARIKGRKAFLPNCYIPKHNGGTTEIDLIFLHESGVYVIESKNYSGWIFGDEEQEYWTQCLQSVGGIAAKKQFYNPLWQNEIHIYALMELLQDDTFPYYSYIVFGDNCELKNIRLTSGNHHVTYYEYLLQDISGNAQQMGRCLSNEKMDELYSLLVKFTDAESKTYRRGSRKTLPHYPTRWNMDMSAMRRTVGSSGSQTGFWSRKNILGLFELSKVPFHL